MQSLQEYREFSSFARSPIADSPSTSQSEASAQAGVDRSDAKPLLTPEDVARRLNVSRDWVWEHPSRKSPYLPVIRVSDGALRYRASQIEEFVSERERLSALPRKRR